MNSLQNQITRSICGSSVSLSFLFLLFFLHRLSRFHNHCLGRGFNLGGRRSSTHDSQTCWSTGHLISGNELGFFFKLSNRRQNKQRSVTPAKLKLSIPVPDCHTYLSMLVRRIWRPIRVVLSLLRTRSYSSSHNPRQDCVTNQTSEWEAEQHTSRVNNWICSYQL